MKDETREPGADVFITNFQRMSVRSDGKFEWLLKAKEAYLFQNENDENSRIVVYHFSMDQYDAEGNVSGVITADRGEIDYENQEMLLKGDVVFREGELKSFEGESMTYNMDKKVLSSDGPVVIKERDIYTECLGGLVVEKAKEKQICKRPSGYTTSSGENKGENGPGEIEGLFH